MKKDDIPQDDAILSGSRMMYYAVNENGSYTTGKSTGWEPANLANIQAWEFIDQRTREIHEQVTSGKISPIAYYMEVNQMDASLLAKYMGLPKREIKRHLKPRRFKKLEDHVLEKYAAVFQISKEELISPPSVAPSKAMIFGTGGPADR